MNDLKQIIGVCSLKCFWSSSPPGSLERVWFKEIPKFLTRRERGSRSYWVINSKIEGEGQYATSLTDVNHLIKAMQNKDGSFYILAFSAWGFSLKDPASFSKFDKASKV